MRSGNLELPQYSTCQNFVDSHKLIKNTVTPNSNPFNDKEGWKHDRREVKARNRKIRHNKKNYISNELE